MSASPLRPDELATYRTDILTPADRPDTSEPTPGQGASPSIGLGALLGLAFVVTLLFAILLALPMP